MVAAPMSPPRNAPARTFPVLESGMTLSRPEFHRRYKLRPDIDKAELVQGVVYVPVRIAMHATPENVLATWLGSYVAAHPGTEAANNGTVRLASASADEVQPDVMLWYLEGGRARLASDGYLDGAPELVVEIAASSASYDLGSKLVSYQQAGVVEYVVWVVEDERIDWFTNDGGAFVPLPADADGWTASKVFPGLRLHRARVLGGDRSGAALEA